MFLDLFRKATPVADLLVKTLNGRIDPQGLARLESSELLMPDPYYKVRGNPKYWGHDALGFRNPKVPESAPVICVGDSQTYGMTLQPHESWPAILEAITKVPVYNVGIGGWGTFEYALAIDELLPLRPSHVIVGLSVTTDILEAFNNIRTSVAPLARRFWKSEYAQVPPVVLALNARIEQYFQEQHKNGIGRADALRAGLENNLQGINYCEFRTSDCRYYLDEEVRLSCQDLALEGIQCGLKISFEALNFIRDLSHNHGFTLHLLLIPSKEHLVYLRRHDAEIHHLGKLELLARNEQRAIREIERFCLDTGIHCINPVKILAENVENQLYHNDSDDGHFSPLGTALLAHIVQHHLQLSQDTARGGDVYPMY